MRTLIVDGDPGGVELYEEMLPSFGCRVIASLRTFQETIEWLLRNDITELDVILIDDSVVPGDLEFEGVFQIVQTLKEEGFQGRCIVCADVPRTIKGVIWLPRDEKGIFERLVSVFATSVAS